MAKFSTQRVTLDEDGLSWLEILCFLKDTYKTILFFGVIGMLISIAYLGVAPHQYEAKAQIAMAQIANNKQYPLGVNIEEPKLLIYRLSSPASYTPETVAACGLQSQDQAGASLRKLVNLSAPKGVDNLVELKVVGASPQIAQACAQAIFDLIKVTQAQIMAPYVEEAKVKLAEDESRLEKAKEAVSKLDKLGQSINLAYLYNVDEIRYLLGEIDLLKTIVASNPNRLTHLIAPIYADDRPIAPKLHLILLIGLIGGMVFGGLIALMRK